jgi:hypothetical protein
MKTRINTVVLMGVGVVLAGCTFGNGMICGPQTPAAYCDREAYQKLAHPKSYGQYWTKPAMTTESWRQDWVACGGQANGQFFIDKPAAGTTRDPLLDWQDKRKKLDACMQSKSYSFEQKK